VASVTEPGVVMVKVVVIRFKARLFSHIITSEAQRLLLA
jgi:hypothetical protein